MIKTVELFAGVGGFRVGLNNIKEINEITGKAVESGNYSFVWSNQWEPSTKIQRAFDCYVTRFGPDSTSNENINKVNKKGIPDHDLLVGGFPCQDYSVARSLTNEKGIEGIKGVLWWDIVDILKEKNPNYVLLENVDRLLKSPAKQRGRDFAIILRTFNENGYIVQWRVINPGEYGMPQRRRRVFIFATKKSLNYSTQIIDKFRNQESLIEESIFNKKFPIKVKGLVDKKDLNKYETPLDITENYDNGKFLNSGFFIDDKSVSFDYEEQFSGNSFTLKKIVEKAAQINNDYTDYYIEESKLPKWREMKSYKRIERKRSDGTTYYYSEGNMSFPDSLDLPARTMLTSESTLNRSSHVIGENGKYRTLTELEAELIQMFPLNWTNTGMTKRQRFFMMGNALVTGILSEIEEELTNIIKIIL